MTDMVTTDAAIETGSALERRIDMTVVLAEIEKDVDQRLKQMSRTVKMAGFRPGKVPMKMVAQQYGSQARSDAIGAAEGTRVLAAPGAPPVSAVAGPATVAVGPAGGWTPTEAEQFVAAGFTPAGLGPHVLRTPTAVAAALARLYPGPD